jgi:hypothetical protein
MEEKVPSTYWIAGSKAGLDMVAKKTKSSWNNL